MSFILKFIFLLLMTNLSWAQLVQSEFTITQDQAVLKSGDIFEATLRFWPIESADLSEFKKLEKTTFFNAFYLAQISSLGTSQNNADVIELKGSFVVLSGKVVLDQVIKYKDQSINISIKKIKIEETPLMNDDFFIANQSLEIQSSWIYYSLFFGLIIFLLFIKRSSLKKILGRFGKNEKMLNKKKYDDLFRAASKREDFELVYREREAWLLLLVEKTAAHKEFLEVIDQYQYKKDWSNEEYSEVRNSFDLIRRSFEK